MPVDSGVQVRSRSATSWPSEDDWSDEDERHDDSDTIVISSRSRILISPRKKGTKAVSRLLGASTAENVVQMLSGTQDVMQKLQSSQVRVHKSRKHEGSERKQNNTSAQPIQNDKRTASSTGAAKATTRSRVETLLESEKSDGEFQFESGSDVDLSSEDGQDKEEDMPQRAPSQPARTKAPSSAGVAATQQREKQPLRPRSIHAATYDSGDDYNDEMSDGNATAVTHASSRDSKSKFDDHLHVSKDNMRSSTKSTAQTKQSKHTKTSNSFMDQSSIDMNNSIILPTPTQEMEDLKQTLKNLASQDTPSSGDFVKQRSTKSTKAISSAYAQQHQRARMTTRQREQVIAAPVMHLSTESDAWSLGEAVSKLDGSKKNGAMIVRSEDDDSGDDLNASSTGSISSTPEVARRLFTTPPPRQKAVSKTPSTVPLTGASHRNSPSSFHSSPAYKNSFNQNTPSPSTSVLTPSPGALPPSNAQGSRAVLSALKALQDKIRRLEEEREKLLQELSDVKVKARKREAEFASSEKKLTYELGQSKESARAAYDALRSEKEELKLELVKYAERRKAMQAELQHAQKLVSTYSAKSEDLQSQVHLSDSQQKSLHKEMDAMHAAHKQEVQDLNGQVITLQKEADASHEQVKLLESQFDRESNNHAETRERLRDAEQTIAAISQLNEKLVAKVWEANELANKAAKKSKKLQQQQRTSTLSKPTAASRAASITGGGPGSATPRRSSSRRESTLKKTKTSGASSTRRGSASTGKKTKRGSVSLNNLELLRAANLGRDVPFVLGTSANRSFSIISNVQDAIRQCDTSYAMPVTNPASRPPTPKSGEPRRSKTKTRKASTTTADRHSASASASILGVPSSRSAPATLLGARTRNQSVNDKDTAPRRTSARPSAIRVPTPTTTYPNTMQSHIMEDLEAAVMTAEKEFEDLNKKYKAASAKVESGGPGAAQASSQLRGMLDELEAKGKQLNLLKQVYEQAANSTINPIRHVVHSPEAIRRKTASLRILNEYRQLEREAKSPRHELSDGAVTPRASRHASFFSDHD